MKAVTINLQNQIERLENLLDGINNFDALDYEGQIEVILETDLKKDAEFLKKWGNELITKHEINLAYYDPFKNEIEFMYGDNIFNYYRASRRGIEHYVLVNED